MADILTVPNAIVGIDVSHYQGSIDWAKVAESGVKFAYIKATQGMKYSDPRLAFNANGADVAGIPYGLYHVFVSGGGQAQIDHWLHTRDQFKAQLPMWLDIEPGAVTEDTEEEVIDFLSQVVPAIVYCSPGTAQALTDPKVQDYKLAIAHYTSAEKPNTVQWPTWTFWQRQSDGEVPGITTAVDIDWFNGSMEDFQKLIQLPT